MITKKGVIIIGALGVIGQYHLKNYKKLGIPIFGLVDIKQSALTEKIDFYLNKFSINNVIFDICTPTDTHEEIIIDLVNKGFKNFIVEKPPAANLSGFNNLKFYCNNEIKLFICNNYLFSKAFQSVFDHYKKNDDKSLQKISSIFNKDRRGDSLRGRNICRDGNMPSIFLFETYHQIGLALKLVPNLNVVKSEISSMCFDDGKVIKEHGSCLLQLVDKENIVTVDLMTNLQSEILREMSIYLSDGSSYNLRFAKDSTLHSSSYFYDKNGSVSILHDGCDNTIYAMLKSAWNAFHIGNIPFDTSIIFSEKILKICDDALVIKKVI
ncbi:MAG: Gfo/Idh/MocA family oxidoreductase [Patescibacteria group bacterium]|nr:Gfo/Idh/MocA family oxidoreductase [Patescibacteria group bacterium]MDD4694866.1 Gfo/Idh/MocA family oxidoreductase [Patescibacteria group bacterium]